MFTSNTMLQILTDFFLFIDVIILLVVFLNFRPWCWWFLCSWASCIPLRVIKNLFWSSCLIIYICVLAQPCTKFWYFLCLAVHRCYYCLYGGRDSVHYCQGSHHSLVDYVCFRVPEESLELTNYVGIIRRFSNYKDSIENGETAPDGVLLCIPDGYHCVDVALYKV